MKKILIAVALTVITFLAHAQDKPNRWAFTLPVDSSTNKITFQEVVRVGGSTKDELYTRAHNWFANTFNADGASVQQDDKVAGKLSARGTYHSTYLVFLKPNPYTLYYTVNVTIKDARYRYEITDFTIQDDITEYNKDPKNFPLEPMALNPKNRNSKGEYKGDQKNYLEAAKIAGADVSQSLKAALYKAPAINVKSKDDF